MKQILKIVLFVSAFSIFGCKKIEIEKESYPIFEISIANMEEQLYYDDDNYLELVLSAAGKDGDYLNERYTLTLNSTIDDNFFELIDSNENITDCLNSWEAPLSKVQSSSYNGSGIGSDTKYTKFKLSHVDFNGKYTIPYYITFDLRFEKSGKTYTCKDYLITIYRELGNDSKPRYKYAIFPAYKP